MYADVKIKVDKLSEIWNNYILNYNYCSNKIKFNDDIKTNYFGDMIGCFHDTLDIIFENKYTPHDFSEKFTYSISFLQSIYIQQDLIEELLFIFKTKISKGSLKNDDNYSINREIRNELIGHPIRKIGGDLLSSTLFSYQSDENNIQYLRYHKNNNFNPEVKSYSFADIRLRHKLFLETYLEKILLKLKNILNDFISKLKCLQCVIENKDFSKSLDLIELYFESFFYSDYAYDKNSLIKIYRLKDTHIRYNNFINEFQDDLKDSVCDNIDSINQIFSVKNVYEESFFENSLKDFKSCFSNLFASKKKLTESKTTFHYEIGKIANKRNLEDFDFFSEILIDKCKDNELIINELYHMRNNIENEIEYYTSLKLISTHLKV